MIACHVCLARVGQTMDKSAITSVMRRLVTNCTVSHQYEPISATRATHRPGPHPPHQL